MKISDPYDFFDQYDAEQSAKLEMLPRCCDCDEPIQQEDAVFLNGDWYCDACLTSYRREVNPEW